MYVGSAHRHYLRPLRLPALSTANPSLHYKVSMATSCGPLTPFPIAVALILTCREADQVELAPQLLSFPFSLQLFFTM